MPVRLENVSGRPVRLDLPSGASLRLSPGQTSPPLAAADVAHSPRVDRLVAQGTVVVRDEAPEPAAPPRAAAKKATAEKAGDA